MPLSARRFDRRRFIGGAAGLALLSGCQAPAAAPVSLGGQLETTRLRVAQPNGMCVAPQFVAQELLRSEGFADLQYVRVPSDGLGPALAAGEIDISMNFAAPVILQVDAGDPVVILAGAHVGCFELFGTNGVRAIRDLKGRTVAIVKGSVVSHLYVASLLAHVGLNPRADVTWVEHEPAEAVRLLAEGRVDAFLGFPPLPQDLRAKRIAQVIVNSLTDRPWSQYYCCCVYASRAFVERNPVATARALRGLLNGIDQTGRDPEAAVSFLVKSGYTTQYEDTLEAVRALHSAGWRSEYDPEDTLRYYSLRLHEAGMIKSTPDKIIARGTDWRFLNEVKRDRGTTASAAGFFCHVPAGAASDV
jgi:NitT/TauT family transport system substrate-binding protein